MLADSKLRHADTSICRGKDCKKSVRFSFFRDDNFYFGRSYIYTEK